MTADDHLKTLVGDLIVQIALLKAEIDVLKAPPPMPAPPPEPPRG